MERSAVRAFSAVPLPIHAPRTLLPTLHPQLHRAIPLLSAQLPGESQRTHRPSLQRPLSHSSRLRQLPAHLSQSHLEAPTMVYLVVQLQESSLELLLELSYSSSSASAASSKLDSTLSLLSLASERAGGADPRRSRLLNDTPDVEVEVVEVLHAEILILDGLVALDLPE